MLINILVSKTQISSLHCTFGFNFVFIGDPKGFVTFLDEHGLPRGLIPRYRGNRLHILFHTCGILIQHYHKLQSFLFSGVVLCGGLRNSLFQDFTSETG